MLACKLTYAKKMKKYKENNNLISLKKGLFIDSLVILY